MKKSDLIPLQDYIKTRNGDLYCFTGDGFVKKYCRIQINDYNDDLISIDGDSDWDIINVYRINQRFDLGNIESTIRKNLQNIKDGDVNPIWRRDEQVKLSHDEYAILRNLDKKCKWIARDKHGSLCLYHEQPSRADECWIGNNNVFRFFTMYGHMFQFVQWVNEAPYYIPGLLSWYESCSEEE